jgi:hypothetical protein
MIVGEHESIYTRTYSIISKPRIDCSNLSQMAALFANHYMETHIHACPSCCNPNTQHVSVITSNDLPLFMFPYAVDTQCDLVSILGRLDLIPDIIGVRADVYVCKHKLTTHQRWGD